MGFIFCPSADKHRVSTPGRASSSFGPKVPTFRSCSARAVLPDFSGLLHSVPCRFVAPCSRLGFARLPVRSTVLPKEVSFPRLSHWRHTLQSISLQRSLSPVTPDESGFTKVPYPLAVVPCLVPSVPVLPRFPSVRPGSSTSRLCSTLKSVAVRGCCHLQAARCSHGLLWPTMLVMPAGRIAPARHKLHPQGARLHSEECSVTGTGAPEGATGTGDSTTGLSRRRTSPQRIAWPVRGLTPPEGDVRHTRVVQPKQPEDCPT